METKYVRATVTGIGPIRDALTRESVPTGGTVVLLVREPGTQKPPPCPRHPRKGIHDPNKRCLCHGTLLQPLLEQGAIGDVEPYDPDAKPARGKA